MSTNENIVYVGDTVEHIHERGLPQSVIWGSDVYLTGHIGEQASHAMFVTPDGRPVTGFGGANYDAVLGAMNIIAERAGQEFHHPPVEFVVGVAVALYGEWAREPTEADLKRRGLLT